MKTSFRIYHSFEEFEREELRPGSTFGRSIDDFMDDMLLQELDFDPDSADARRKKWDDDAEDDDEPAGE